MIFTLLWVIIHRDDQKFNIIIQSDFWIDVKKLENPVKSMNLITLQSHKFYMY